VGTNDNRTYGPFSYEVPEFAVTHVEVVKGFTLDRSKLAREHDVIVYEDGKLYGEFVGQANIPICYIVTDSTLSQEHYEHRLWQAEQVDLILVDWDRLERFERLGKPVRRLSYCVNDRLFYDYGEPKTVDLAMHASPSPELQELHEQLLDFCRQRGYTYASGRRRGEDYARAFNRTKLVVDLARNPITRNHRAFDVMSSRACLLTSPLPEVGDEIRTAGSDYREWSSRTQLFALIDGLISDGRWWDIANHAYRVTHSVHTWTIRARQLRRILNEVFPQLRGRDVA
jgi:spore maturation protein CgeB